MFAYDPITEKRNKFMSLYAQGYLLGCSIVSDKIIKMHRKAGSVGSAGYAADLYNYATVNFELGLYGAALKMYGDAAGLFAGFPDCRLRYSDCLNNLGLVLAKLGLYAQAEDRLKAAEKLVPADSECGIDVRYNLAGLYYKSGDYQKAIAEFNSLVSVLNGGAVLADAHNYLGYSYEKSGLPDEAFKHFKTAMTLTKREQGETEEYLALVYYFSRFCADIKNYDESLKYYALSLRLIKRLSAEKSVQYLDAINQMADTCAESGNNERALRLRLKALRIMKSFAGENHMYYANNLKNAAASYIKKGDTQRAEQFLLRSIGIKSELLGGSNPDCIMDTIRLCTMYIERSDYQRAVRLLQKTVKSLKLNGCAAAMSVANELESLCGCLRACKEEGINKHGEIMDEFRKIQKLIALNMKELI